MNSSAADDDSPKTGDDVDDALGDCPQPAFVDVKPVKGGALIKQGERNKSSFKRYLFLLQDEYLYYYTDTTDAGPRGYTCSAFDANQHKLSRSFLPCYVS